jgi:glycosyltransferase involved in cell wall biosynthesis
MKILLVSNFVSHHQLPIARSIVEIIGRDYFRFAAISTPDSDRLSLGWCGSDSESWILRVNDSDKDKDEYDFWWRNADVVITGMRDFTEISKRLSRGQSCFYMSERWWKPPLGPLRLLSPKFLRMALSFKKISTNKNFYYLAIGPYAARDISYIIDDERAILKWGYFTAHSNNDDFHSGESTALRILWVGRMLEWKRVDIIIKAASELLRNGIPVQVKFVGGGPKRKALERLARALLPSGSYLFCDSIASTQIPKLMRQHDVYVLPSSSYEGWGAVVNEAMSCGLAVVASSKTGAAAAMLKNNVNGLLFDPGDWLQLSVHLQRLATDERFRASIGEAAQKTITDLWAPSVAAKRLVEFSASLIENRPLPFYDNGPFSLGGSWINN